MTSWTGREGLPSILIVIIILRSITWIWNRGIMTYVLLSFQKRHLYAPHDKVKIKGAQKGRLTKFMRSTK